MCIKQRIRCLLTDAIEKCGKKRIGDYINARYILPQLFRMERLDVFPKETLTLIGISVNALGAILIKSIGNLKNLFDFLRICSVEAVCCLQER